MLNLIDIYIYIYIIMCIRMHKNVTVKLFELILVTCSHETACYPGMCERDPGKTSTSCTCDDGFERSRCLTSE